MTGPDAPHDHGHSHSHDHGHDHAHGHSHDHGDERPTAAPDEEEPLARGAGHDQILFLDCFSGIAGDMTIAALVDLGVPSRVVVDAVAALPIEGFELTWSRVERSQIVATKFDVVLTREQPLRTYAAIDAMLAGAGLPSGVEGRARAIFERLGRAESRAHRMPLSEVHFHEVGAVDAIVDIVGAAACLDHLGAEVIASPLPMGRGFVRADHGMLPVPAPGTVSCLAGVPTYEVALDVELVTPTGAAIVATSAGRFTRWPSFSPDRVGHGAGTKILPDRPTLLRAILGRPTATAEPTTTHVELVVNVDDMTGELAGHTLRALLAAGAVDAWATPATMKKGRPGFILTALAHDAAADRVAACMLRETTSIGLRRRRVSRDERPRRIVEVETRFGRLPLKVSEGPTGPAQVKPEFDRCAEAAEAHGVPVREVLAAALTAFTTTGD